MYKDKKTKSKILIALLILITQRLYFRLNAHRRKQKKMQKKLKMTVLKK